MLNCVPYVFALAHNYITVKLKSSVTLVPWRIAAKWKSSKIMQCILGDKTIHTYNVKLRLSDRTGLYFSSSWKDRILPCLLCESTGLNSAFCVTVLFSTIFCLLCGSTKIIQLFLCDSTVFYTAFCLAIQTFWMTVGILLCLLDDSSVEHYALPSIWQVWILCLLDDSTGLRILCLANCFSK